LSKILKTEFKNVLNDDNSKIRLQAVMKKVVVGSSAQCDVNIANDFVSRRHCRILYSSDGVWIEDLDSSNGTYVDGEDIPEGKRVKIDVTSEVSLAKEVELGWSEIQSFRPHQETSGGASGARKGPAAGDRGPKKAGRSMDGSDPPDEKSPSDRKKRSEKQASGHEPIPKENRKSLQNDRSNSGGQNGGSSSKGSIAAAIFTMFAISLLLFWLPFLGPVIAGYVGGKKAGGVGKAIVATLLPGVLAGFLVFSAAGSVSGIPLLGAIAGAGATALILVHVGPLLLGALIGGIAA
jgi:hypothetical protein